MVVKIFLNSGIVLSSDTDEDDKVAILLSKLSLSELFKLLLEWSKLSTLVSPLSATQVSTLRRFSCFLSKNFFHLCSKHLCFVSALQKAKP